MASRHSMSLEDWPAVRTSVPPGIRVRNSPALAVIMLCRVGIGLCVPNQSPTAAPESGSLVRQAAFSPLMSAAGWQCRSVSERVVRTNDSIAVARATCDVASKIGTHASQDTLCTHRAPRTNTRAHTRTHIHTHTHTHSGMSDDNSPASCDCVRPRARQGRQEPTAGRCGWSGAKIQEQHIQSHASEMTRHLQGVHAAMGVGRWSCRR